MKKNMLYYLSVWAVAFIAFNAIYYVVGSKSPIGYYWPGHIACIVAFIGQLVCSLIALGQKDIKKQVLNAPLISTSYAGLISTISISIFFAIRKFLDNWIGIVALIGVLVITFARIISIKANADMVSQVEEKVAVKTSYMKTLVAKSEVLNSVANNSEAKQLTKNVYEALRFSDTMSSQDSVVIESQINELLNQFEYYIKQNDLDNAKSIAETLTNTIKERNVIVRMSKL